MGWYQRRVHGVETKTEESMKQEESSENIVEAEVEKETIECLSEGSASDLGSLESPLDDSDADNSIEGEENHDSALENEKEDEITKEKKSSTTSQPSEVEIL